MITGEDGTTKTASWNQGTWLEIWPLHMKQTQSSSGPGYNWSITCIPLKCFNAFCFDWSFDGFNTFSFVWMNQLKCQAESTFLLMAWINTVLTIAIMGQEWESLQSSRLSVLGVLWVRNSCLLLDLFFGGLKILLNPLTYSALVPRSLLLPISTSDPPPLSA